MTIKISKKLIIALFAVMMLLTGIIIFGKLNVEAAGNPTTETVQTTLPKTGSEIGNGVVFDAEPELPAAQDATSSKALAAAITIGLAAAAGAIAMGMAIGKSAEGISRQPEAAGEIRTSLMLGLVFIETAIIYALIVTILIIFVM